MRPGDWKEGHKGWPKWFGDGPKERLGISPPWIPGLLMATDTWWWAQQQAGCTAGTGGKPSGKLLADGEADRPCSSIGCSSVMQAGCRGREGGRMCGKLLQVVRQ